MRQEEIAEAMTKYIEDEHPAMSELSNWIADNNISKFDLAMIVVHQHALLQRLENIEKNSLIEAAEKAETKRLGYKLRQGGEVFPPIKEKKPKWKQVVRKCKDARRANANNK